MGAAERGGIPDGLPDGEQAGVPDMMPYQAYQMCEAGRPRTAAARRDADVRLGQMAVAVSQLWRDVTRPVRALRSFQNEPGRLADERTQYAPRGGAAIPVP
jgi:hypothetical protein